MATQDGADTTQPSEVTLRPMPSQPPQPPEARFGDRLKDARQQLGLSVEAFSRLCKSYDLPDGKGISPPTLGRYEAGETLPGVRELRVIADALGVPAQWLIDGSVPTWRGAEAAQALAVALRDFIEYVGGDIKLGQERMSEIAERQRAITRHQRLSEARRPQD